VTRFMSAGQAALLAIFITNILVMGALYFSPLRDHHVLPEGAAIIAGTALAASFRRIYALLVPLLTAYMLVVLKIYGVAGMDPGNFAYVFLTACTMAAPLLGLLVRPRHG